MTRFRPFPLLVAGALAGLPGPAMAATPGSTPHTHSKCAELGLTDHACHRQIVEAGGVARSVPNSVRSFTQRNFRGWSEEERWYRKYVEYSKRNLKRAKPMRDVIHHYPNFPVLVPYYLVYP